MRLRIPNRQAITPDEHQVTAERRFTSRRAILAMELLLVLPILMGILLAMVEFSLLLNARQQVTIAAREGVRVAALGGDQQAVKTVIDRILGHRDGAFHVTMTRENGDQLEPHDPIEIVVKVPTASFVPDLLKFLGFSVKDTSIVCRATMLKE